MIVPHEVRIGQINPIAIDPWKLIDELDAVSEIRNAKTMGRALEKFANIFSRNGPETVEELVERAGCYHFNTLKRARLRLDIVAMNLHRQWIKELLDPAGGELEHVDIYIYADASPQWKRGLEYFAVSYDLFHRDKFYHRLFPLITMSKDMLGKIGKGISFTWASWLMAGPDFDTFTRFLSRVKRRRYGPGSRTIVV